MRLDGERLQIGPLDASAEHVVARGLAGGLELLDLRDAIGRERDVAFLQLGDARGEERLEVGALHLQRHVRPLLLLVLPRGLARLVRGTRGGDESAALKQRLREVGVERVGVRLIEHRADRLAARALVDVRIAAGEAELRQHVGARIGELRVGDVDLGVGQADLVALAKSHRHRLLERQTKRVARREERCLCVESVANDQKGERDGASRPPNERAAKALHQENIRLSGLIRCPRRTRETHGRLRTSLPRRGFVVRRPPRGESHTPNRYDLPRQCRSSSCCSNRAVPTSSSSPRPSWRGHEPYASPKSICAVSAATKAHRGRRPTR